MISRDGNRLRRFEEVLDLLPRGYVFDGELVVLDDTGRPLFNELLFARRLPTYVAFDLLMANGVDLRPLPLRKRKAALARLGERAEGWIALTNGSAKESTVSAATKVAYGVDDASKATMAPAGPRMIQPKPVQNARRLVPGVMRPSANDSVN